MMHQPYCSLGAVEAPKNHPTCDCKDPLKGLIPPTLAESSDGTGALVDQYWIESYKASDTKREGK